MRRELNPEHVSRFAMPGYTDLGWQLHSGNSQEVADCRNAGHNRKQIDNSMYKYRGTDMIYVCDQCKNLYHIDMSD